MRLYAVTMDMSITFGNVLQIAATIGAVAAAYSAIRERLIRIETQMEAQVGPLWREFERRRESRSR